MAYDEKLAGRIREALSSLKKVEEKKMFSGLAFMVNGKMCVNVSRDEMMCRFDPELNEVVLERRGVRPMIMKNRLLKGYCYVSAEGFKSKKDFDYWIGLVLEFNKKAKVTKKKGK